MHFGVAGYPFFSDCVWLISSENKRLIYLLSQFPTPSYPIHISPSPSTKPTSPQHHLLRTAGLGPGNGVPAISLVPYAVFTLKHIFKPMLLDCQLFRRKGLVPNETGWGSEGGGYRQPGVVQRWDEPLVRPHPCTYRGESEVKPSQAACVDIP